MRPDVVEGGVGPYRQRDRPGNPAGGRQLTKFPASGVKNPRELPCTARRTQASRGLRRAPGSLAVVVLGILGGCSAGSSSCGDARERPAHEDPQAAALARSIPDERLAYVTNNGSDSLSLLDLDAPGQALTVSLDFDDRREAPHHVAIDVARNRLYVAFAHPRAISAPTSHRQHGRSAIAPGELVTLERSSLRLLRRNAVDESPGDLVLGHDGSALLVSHYDLARAFAGAARSAPPRDLFATLQLWNPGTGQKRAERAVCVAPHGIAMTQDGTLALLACYGSDEIALVSLESAELATEKIPVGPSPGPLGAPRYGPYSITLSPDEHVAVVAELEGKELRVFDLRTRSFDESRRIELGARAMMPCFAPSGTLYLPLAAPDGLARIDVGRGVVETRVDFDASCTSPHVTACRADGRVFVVCEGDHVGPGQVHEVDPTTLARRSTWNVGVLPDAMVFAH